jgi:hypothetical protein
MSGILRFVLSVLRNIVRWLEKLLAPGAVPAITITRVRPGMGWPGTILTIDGTGFSDSLDGNFVGVGGEAALVVRASATQLVVAAGEHAITGPIQVTVGANTATAPDPFVILPWPEMRDSASSGPPVFFHGPQEGTPGVGKQDQPVLVIFTQAAGDPPVDIAAEINAEMASFKDAERFWREASYASSAPPHGTSISYQQGPWINLPRPRNTYVWDDADIGWARNDLYTKTKRWIQMVGNRAYCAHQGGGLGIADVALPNGPSEVDRIAPGWIAYHVAVSAGTAWVAAAKDGLIAISVGGSPLTQLSQTVLGGNLRGCDVSGDTLVAAAMDGGVEMYHISNPASPVRRDVKDAGSDWATCVKIAGSRAYVGAGKSLRVYDLSNPAALKKLGQASTGDWVLGVDVSGNTCVVATDGSGVAIFDVAGLDPQPQVNLKDALHVFNVRISGNRVYAACGSDGILIADISDVTNPKKLALSPTGNACYDITPPIAANFCVMALGGDGLADVDIANPMTPNMGLENFLTATPPLGGDWDLTALRTNLDNAANSRGKIKGDALFVHALMGAQSANPGLNLNAFEGFVVIIHGFPGRGQSFLASSVSFEGGSVALPEAKGFIWLPSHPDPDKRTTWGRKAHEVGHWFRGWGVSGLEVMPDIYTQSFDDGTVLVGDAEKWDMAGDHDQGPLFSGHQADALRLFDPSKIARRTWSPSAAPVPETFEIAVHSTSEAGAGRIHLLELKVSDSLSYYVEVRQKPELGAYIFDANIPVPPAALGLVLVTRVDEAQSISNTFERPTMLFGTLDVGESAVDAARLLRIEANAVLDVNPLVFRVIVHWNEQPPDDPDGKFDLRITPWNTDDYTTPDIWVNSPRNDQGGKFIYTYHQDGDETQPILTGDKPWVKRKNTIFARISNSGIQDVADVFVTAYINSPPGIGDNGTWETLKTVKVDAIAANASQVVQFDWTPAIDKHTCMSVAIFPQVGEITANNNRAQENVAQFDSAGSSSHDPVILEAVVRSPFSVWRRVDLRVRGLPLGWHAIVDKQWVWTGPKGTVPVTALIWTDLDSPRGQDQHGIPSEALLRVEGWTDFGTHRYLPIGGILAPVRANKRTHIAFEASAVNGRIRVMARLQPPSSTVPGMVEITDAAGAPKLFPVITDATGHILIEVPVARGRYDVQVFTASTPQAAEAESEVRQVVVE